MEYRFFYPINENVYHTKWKTRLGRENRTDIYFVLPELSNNSDEFHVEHGLKLRNKKKLELKIREKRFTDGQELWRKTINSNDKIRIDNIDSIIKILKKSNENQLIERLISSERIILCYVSKHREQEIVNSGFTQELTGLHLRFIRSNDKSQIGNDIYFETVCIEPNNSQLMHEKIIRKVLQEHGNVSVNPMGYPEFLFREYQQIING